MAAKLHVPARRPWTVVRERLLDRVSQGVTGPLTLICAPAGAGKTVAAGSWVAAGGAPGPVTWLIPDREDARPGLFWSYVLAGLADSGVPVADVGLPDEPDAVDRSLLIRLAAALSAWPEPVVLVLDQAEVLTGPAVWDGVDFLLRHAAPQLRLVVVTRVQPPLPLHRYRVAGSVTEIGFEDLAFTRDEVAALVRAHGAELPDSATDGLAEKTRGWAAGLRFAVLALRNGSAGGDPDGGDGEPRDLATYFVTEVLDTQPPEVREFLLRTSVVDRLWPELAAALTGRRDAAGILAALAHANAFLVPEDGAAFAYHPLVRDLLRAQLHAEAPGRIGKLHRKAAHWFATTGRLAEATEHAVAAGDWGYAARLAIADHAIGRLLAGPAGTRLAGLFAAMPADVAGPEGAVIEAAVAATRLDTEMCAKHLLRARELVAVGPSEHAWALQLAIAVTEMVCATARGDVDGALVAIGAAESMLADADALRADIPVVLRALVLASKGGMLLRAGEWDEAATVLTEGAAAADGYLRVVCLGQLALVEALQGRLRRSARSARRALAVAERYPLADADRPAAADVALAWVHAEEYDLGAVRTHAARAAAAADLRADPVSAGMLTLVRARLLRARGDLAGALAAFGPEPAVAPPPWLRRMHAATVAALRLASGAADAAPVPEPAGLPVSPHGVLVAAAERLAAGDAAGADAAVAGFPGQAGLPLDVRVEAGLLAATSELVAGRTDLARGTLDRALGSAAPERLRRPVIEASPRLRRFLRQERELTERHAWLGAAVVGAPHRVVDTTAAAGPVVEALTDKETEVLRYLAALLSTEEIARTMFVSINTVKTHIRGVLRKLAATRRNEAVRRARGLGLV